MKSFFVSKGIGDRMLEEHRLTKAGIYLYSVYSMYSVNNVYSVYSVNSGYSVYSVYNVYCGTCYTAEIELSCTYGSKRLEQRGV